MENQIDNQMNKWNLGLLPNHKQKARVTRHKTSKKPTSPRNGRKNDTRLNRLEGLDGSHLAG